MRSRTGGHAEAVAWDSWPLRAREGACRGSMTTPKAVPAQYTALSIQGVIRYHPVAGGKKGREVRKKSSVLRQND